MNKGLNYTCLFGGGAIRGVAYIGAIKALEELGVKPSTIAGSSVGAIVAGLLAVGCSSDEIKEAFMDVSFDLFKDIKFGFGPLVALSKGEVFLEWLRDLIGKKFYGQNYQKGISEPVRFKDIKNNLVIITTDLKSFECQEFSKFETPDFEIALAIRISSSMPGLMSPYEFEGKTLVDGDLQKSWPMWKLSKNLLQKSSRVLEFRLEGDYDEVNVTNSVSYANAVYSCMTAMASSFVTKIYAHKDKFDYIVLNTGDIVIVDFNMSSQKRESLIESGYKQTIQYFKSVLPAKKERVLNAYNIVQGHVLKLKGFMNLRQYGNVRTELGALFINLSELFDIIDIDDYSAIKRFKDLLYDNLGVGFFGSTKLNNEKLVKTELMQLAQNIDAKVDELVLYLKDYPVLKQ